MKRTLSILLALFAVLAVRIARVEAGCMLRNDGDPTSASDTKCGNISFNNMTVRGTLDTTTADVGISCRNESGGAFAAGDLVYATSWDTTDVPLIALADADNNLMAEYVLAGALANNATGTCYRRIEATVGNTSAAAAEGDEVCLTPTATTTNTWAVEASCTSVSDEFRQIVGVVTVDAATGGKIFFDLPGRLGKIGSNEIQPEGVPLTALEDLARGSIITGQTAGNRPTALDANDSGKIPVGDGTDIVSVSVSGDATLAATGEVTVVSVTDAVDVQWLNNVDIATAATDSVVFDFVPSKIVVQYGCYGVHDTTSEAGHSSGLAVVTITGTDTATLTSAGTAFNNNNTASRWEDEAVDTANIFSCKFGTDASDQGTVITAMTSWTTATKTLLLTHTVLNTTDASNHIFATFTAYR